MSGNQSDYWIYRPKGFYDGWRHVPFPTLYDAMPTAVTADVLEAGLVYAIAILAASFLIVLPGFRKSERFTTFIRIVVALFILASTLVCNFGQEWEVSHINTKTQYRAGLTGDINASIGLKIALRGINVTLKGHPVIQMLQNGTVNETVDYNERLSWDNEGFNIARAGFGPYAGKFNQEFREHQRKGSPYPILWIAEYFTLDGEGIRWGRHYLQAGYYTHIMLWTAFALWILTIILFHMVLRYGGYCSILTGVSLLIGNIIYATLRNPNQLIIPFEDAHMIFHWGWCFWLCLATGIICIIVGIMVVVLDATASEKLADFFNIDVTKDLEEIYLDPREIEILNKPKPIPVGAPESPAAGTSRYQVEMMEQQLSTSGQPSERAYRKKSVFGAKHIAPKPRPPAVPKFQAREEEEDGEDYENNPKSQRLVPPRS